MDKIIWTNYMRNKDVFQGVQKERNIQRSIKNED